MIEAKEDELAKANSKIFTIFILIEDKADEIGQLKSKHNPCDFIGAKEQEIGQLRRNYFPTSHL